MDEPLDCLIVGGGPAGLTAAIYLARFHLDILRGRRRQEPRGADPLHPQPRRLSRRDQRQGADRADEGAGAAIWRRDRGRTASPGSSATKAAVHRRMGLGLGRRAQTVLLATGVTNRRPPMDEALHDEALARGLIRYCPICDGYEVTDKKVGVIGSGSARRRRGAVPARLHRRRDADRARQARTSCQREDQAQARRRRHRHASTGPAEAVAIAGRLHRRRHRRGPLHLRQRLSGARLATPTPSSPSRSARGSTSDGCIVVDAHQRTSVAGPLCRRRRRDRPRPDQPRDGRRRRRRDHHPQRSGEGRAAAAMALGEESGSRTMRPSRDRRCRRGTGSAIACRRRLLDLEQVAGAEILDRDDGAERLARRRRRRAGRSGRRDNIRPRRAAAARRGRPRPATRAEPRRHCGRRCPRSARRRPCRRLADSQAAARARRRRASCAASGCRRCRRTASGAPRP